MLLPPGFLAPHFLGFASIFRHGATRHHRIAHAVSFWYLAPGSTTGTAHQHHNRELVHDRALHCMFRGTIGRKPYRPVLGIGGSARRSSAGRRAEAATRTHSLAKLLALLRGHLLPP